MVQDVLLGAVARVPALDEFDRSAGQFGCECARGEIAFAAAEDQDRAGDVRRAGDRRHRPRHHAATGQRQIGLVAVGADARAHPGGENHPDGNHSR